MVKCWEYHNCRDRDCPAYGKEDQHCWLISNIHKCPNYIAEEKLINCIKCKVFLLNVEYDDIAKTQTLHILIEKLLEYYQLTTTYQQVSKAADLFIFHIKEGVLFVPLILSFTTDRLVWLANEFPRILKEGDIKVVILDLSRLVVEPQTTTTIDRLIRTIELLGVKLILVGASPTLVNEVLKGNYHWEHLPIYSSLQEVPLLK